MLEKDIFPVDTTLENDESNNSPEEAILQKAEELLRGTGSTALTGSGYDNRARTPLQEVVRNLPHDNPGIYTDNSVN